MTTRKKLEALGNVFSAEIDDRLPFQSKAKVYRDLCDEGYLQPFSRVYGGGPFAVMVEGFQLTHAGRITYCESCRDAADE